MNIVIVGDGKVGRTLVSELTDEGHDVVTHAVALIVPALIAGILEPRNAKAFP